MGTGERGAALLAEAPGRMGLCSALMGPLLNFTIRTETTPPMLHFSSDALNVMFIYPPTPGFFRSFFIE